MFNFRLMLLHLSQRAVSVNFITSWVYCRILCLHSAIAVNRFNGLPPLFEFFVWKFNVYLKHLLSLCKIINSRSPWLLSEKYCTVQWVQCFENLTKNSRTNGFLTKHCLGLWNLTSFIHKFYFYIFYIILIPFL